MMNDASWFDDFMMILWGVVPGAVIGGGMCWEFWKWLRVRILGNPP